MELYGLSWEDVATQEGKRREIEVCGQRYTVRQILGDLGCLLEDKYGSQINPELAVRKCDALPTCGSRPSSLQTRSFFAVQREPTWL